MTCFLYQYLSPSLSPSLTSFHLIPTLSQIPDILMEGYKFSSSGHYYSPSSNSMQSAISYLETLPLSDDPEVFGMHTNANVTFSTNESLSLMSALLSLQPRSTGAGAGGMSSDELVSHMQSYIPKITAFMSQHDTRRHM
jgi:hypothetical protein